MILASFLILFGCEANAQKLNVTTIYSEPNRVTREFLETGGKHTYTNRNVLGFGDSGGNRSTNFQFCTTIA